MESSLWEWSVTTLKLAKSFYNTCTLIPQKRLRVTQKPKENTKDTPLPEVFEKSLRLLTTYICGAVVKQAARTLKRLEHSFSSRG